jgi:enolase
MHEAKELRDTGENRYHKRGVLRAVKNVNELIHPALVGMDVTDIDEADSVMIALDGTYNKSNLGANAILSVSLALRRAAALSRGLPLYRFLSDSDNFKMPTPMLNILNGGAHAANNLDIQEFMIIPKGAESFGEAVRTSCEVYHALKEILLSHSLSASVGDEGGFAPDLKSNEEAIELILDAIGEAGYSAGEEVFIGLDVASSEWRCEEGYILPKSRRKMTSDELCEYIADLCEKYPIISIEDGMGEEDFYGWKKLSERFSNNRVLLVGDDLFVTDKERIKKAGEEKIANAVLIKPNQIGTVSEAETAVRCAEEIGYATVMSHRSGETADTFIADLSVALGCPYIKTGAPARSDRVEKYNRLMKIENEMFDPAYFGKYGS